MKCTQDKDMNFNCFAEKVARAGTLAFGEEWNDRLNELAICIYCDGLLDASMIEYMSANSDQPISRMCKFH